MLLPIFITILVIIAMLKIADILGSGALIVFGPFATLFLACIWLLSFLSP